MQILAMPILDNTNLKNADFTGSNIEEAYFEKCILDNTITFDGRVSNNLQLTLRSIF